MAIQSRIINNSLTEIYVGGGNFITQSFPTNFHQFWTKKILTSSENIEDFKEVTSAEKTTIENKDKEWKEPSEEMVAHIASLGVRYNASTGFFECGDVYDLTEAQARATDMALRYIYNTDNAVFMFAGTSLYVYPDIPIYAGGAYIKGGSLFHSDGQLKYVNLSRTKKFNGMSMMFRYCPELRTIQGLKMAPGCPTPKKPFEGCSKLENLELAYLSTDIALPDSPLLSLASIQYMIDNAANTSPITVTLHPDAYARLTDEIITAATAKQINFATETA